MKNNFLLPELPSVEDSFMPTIDTLSELLPEQRRKRQLAAEVCAICFSLAGDFLMSQDESVLDDYNFI